jgi:hypothetical protein
MNKKEIAERANYLTHLLRDWHAIERLRADGAYLEEALSNALDEEQEVWEDNNPCEFEREHIADLVRAVLQPAGK